MMSIKSSRVGMPMAWAAVALLCQFGVLGCSTLFARDSEVSRSLLFGLAELIGIGGVVCGLIGYTLLARVRPSSMGPVISFISGAAFAAVMIVTFRVSSILLPTPSLRLAMDLPFAVALGAASYFLASRTAG